MKICDTLCEYIALDQKVKRDGWTPGKFHKISNCLELVEGQITVFFQWIQEKDETFEIGNGDSITYPKGYLWNDSANYEKSELFAVLNGAQS